MCQTFKRARVRCEILRNQSLAPKVYEMILNCPEVAAEAAPGQFVNLYCHHQGRLLPRPISICEIDKAEGRLHLVYAILGKGTAEISNYPQGERIDLMGPLGNGFALTDQPKDLLIVGGGVGTPPMVELCKQLNGNKTIVTGFRDNPYLVDRFERYGKTFVTTDDGSVGFKGNVIELMEREGLKGTIYACGPTPMLRGVQAYAAKNNLTAYLSLEERMSCGFGACVGCVAKIKADNEAGFHYKKVCKDGPVFTAEEVVFS